MKLLLIFGFFLLTNYIFSQEISFIKQDWEQAQKNAIEKNKYIFMDAYTNWCSWCKEMDKQTFTNKDVIDFMNQNFVPLKMEMETDFGITMAMKYRVTGYPAFLIFNPEGKLIYKISGFQKPDKFLESLRKSLDLNNQLNLKGISNKIDIDFPEFYKLSFNKGKDKKIPDSTTVKNFLKSQKDLFSEISWAVYSRFQSGKFYDNYFFKNIEKYKELFGKDDIYYQLDHLLSRDLQAAMTNKNEKQLEEVLKLSNTYLKEDKEASINCKLIFYQGIQNWEKLAKTVDELVELKGYKEPNQINQYSWTIYQSTDNKTANTLAIKWMKNIVEKYNESAYFDTYASLLFKDKQYNEAEKFAIKAIESAKASNQKAEESSELLNKIKKAKRTK